VKTRLAPFHIKHYLLFVPNTRPFNITVQISFDREGAGVWVLIQADIAAGFQKVRVVEAASERNLKSLGIYANVYYFCPDQTTEGVFNTDRSLKYIHLSFQHPFVKSLIV